MAVITSSEAPHSTRQVCYQMALTGCCDSMRLTVPSEAPSLDISAQLKLWPFLQMVAGRYQAPTIKPCGHFRK